MGKIIDRLLNRFRDKSRADYIATEMEMAQHTLDVYLAELDKSIEMGKAFIAKDNNGTATNGDWMAYQYQSDLADWYGRQVNYGKLIFG